MRPSTSSRSLETTTTATPDSARSLDQRVDLGAGPDIDAAGGLVEQQHPAVRSSQRASTTFCWLPPDSMRTMPVRIGRADVDGRAASAAARRSALSPLTPYRANRPRLDSEMLR